MKTLNSINLIIRFILEIIGLIVLAQLGWSLSDGFASLLLAVGFPLMAAILWGVFAVPGDPSRSGKAPVATRGYWRLLLEGLFFGSIVLSLTVMGQINQAWWFGVVVCIHYAVSYERLKWIVKQ